MVREASRTTATPSTSTAPEHFDVVIVSTSPMCIIAALAERAAGKRVLMVDAADEVGGTWRTTELLGYSNVELGCHELDAIKPVYALLEELGVPLANMQPPPMFISVEPKYFPRRIYYHQRWIRELHDLLTGRRSYDLPWAEKAGLKTKLRAAVRVGRLAIRSLRGSNRPSMYPPNGARDIVTRLDQLAREAGIDIRLSSWLSDVALDREANLVRFRLNGAETTAGHLHLTSSANLGTIMDGDTSVELGAIDTCWQTLYLSLQDCPKPPFAYAVFTNPKLLQRVSDLSRYAVPDTQTPNARLFALTIDESAPESPETAQECLRQLKHLGLIDRGARLHDFTYLPYSFTRIDEWTFREVEHRLEPLVTLHETSLLTPSIARLMKKDNFRALLEQVCARTRAGAGAGAQA